MKAAVKAKPKKMMRMRIVFAAITVLVVGGAAAITQWSAGASAGNATADSKTRQTVPAPTAQEQSLLYRAEQIAMGDCLRAHGFQYWSEPQPAPSVLQLFPYVIDDVTWAKKNGFGGAQNLAETRSAAADPNARYVAGFSASRKQALGTAENGDGPNGPGVLVTLPTGQEVGHSSLGCTASVEASLYGSFSAWYRAENIVDSLSALWQADVVENAEYGRVMEQWSACMRGRGEPYPTPTAAAAPFTNAASDGPSAAATAVATAEAQCADSTDLAKVASTLDAHYRSVVEAQYSDAIATYRTLQLDAVPRARALIG